MALNLTSIIDRVCIPSDLNDADTGFMVAATTFVML